MSDKTREGYKFVMESNSIEDICREPTVSELDEYDRFVALEIVTVQELEKFVSIYEPHASLRTSTGNDVRVGNYFPPLGGARIKPALKKILKGLKRSDDRQAWETHMAYESLHPFNDCNGRSGRMVWEWQMNRVNTLGFMHRFYYQTLSYS